MGSPLGAANFFSVGCRTPNKFGKHCIIHLSEIMWWWAVRYGSFWVGAWNCEI